MHLVLRCAVATAAIILSTAAPTIAKEEVGQTVSAKTTVTGDGGPLAVKAPVHRDERIRTSATGLGEFLFRDGTKFAVGWNSSVVIDKFVFDDSQTVKKLSVNAARGTFRWISGKSKSSAYEIVTPAGTLGIRGTGLDIYVAGNGTTAVVLLDGAATFCGSNGCQELTRRCDVVIATPSGGVASPDRVNRTIFQELGNRQALPFLSGDQRLSRQFRLIRNGCGLSVSAMPEHQGDKDRQPRSKTDRSHPHGGGYDDGGYYPD